MPVLMMRTIGQDLPFQHIKNGVLGLCGIKVVKRFDFGQMSTSRPEKRQHWLMKVKRYAAALK
jgi:putative NADPH-quinone reductase